MNMNMTIRVEASGYYADIYDGCALVAILHAANWADADSKGAAYMAAQTPPVAKIKLRVGGVYLNRLGDTVRIFGYDPESTHPYTGWDVDTLRTYKEDGHWCSKICHDNDIVSETFEDCGFREKYDALLSENLRLRQRLIDICNLSTAI